MKKIWLLGLMLIILGMVLFACRSLQHSLLTSAVISKKTVVPEKKLRYEERDLPDSKVYIVSVPANSQFIVTPAWSVKANTVSGFFQQNRAIAVFNAGFFDPVNEKSTSYIILHGKVVANPKHNPRLVNNPRLKSELPKIFNRTEFRQYMCGQTIRYDITTHETPPPTDCQLVNAVGAGPRLLPELNLEDEGFVSTHELVIKNPENHEDKLKKHIICASPPKIHSSTKHNELPCHNSAEKKYIKSYRTYKIDAIGSTQPNARTAVGITPDGTVVLVMVAQKPNVTNSGMSLFALADLMKSLGVDKAMNLDGGSSSSLDYNGKTVYGKVDSHGNPVARRVKSVLLVQQLTH